MDREGLTRYVAQLAPHDASVALALLELVRRADDEGALERGEWLAALRAAYRRLGPGSIGGAESSGADEVAPEELGRYLEEHAVAALASRGIARSEPEGPAWEQLRLTADLWAELATERASVVAELEAAVRNLLDQALHRAAPVSDGNGRRAAPGSVLRARSLIKVYRRRKVVNEVDLDVSQGEIVGLLGPNGAGKTTTFYMIVGLISPDHGKVFLDGHDLASVPMYQRARRGIGYLAQEPSVFRRLTVEENILAILETLGLERAECEARLEALLDELTIKHLRSARAYSLSGGERRRLEITRALVSDPKFMLLDEPFAGVDPIAVHDIQQIVAGLRHRGIGVIITDHNVEQTLDIVDRAYIMYDGRVRVSGTVAELVWNDEVAEIYFGPTLTARMRERYRPPKEA
ncbi:MAG: LPS export ABC transporter ATP-binding protein [Gemmatimonadetes bacterium]|nr:LPS export ABC transporter ATP-binding protein [Gemmatimonadota bacterium]